MTSKKSSRTRTRRSTARTSAARKGAARKTVSRSSCQRKTSQALSVARSRTARTQKRHSDGTFAKGFKKTTSPKTKTTSAKKTAAKVPATHTSSKKSPAPKSKVPKKTTTSGSGNRLSKNYTPKMYAAVNAFDFRCADSTKEKVVKTVADNFTKDEIEKISRYGKPIVNNDQSVTTDGKSAYSRPTDRNGAKTPIISFPRKPEESSVTHEVIHHLKTVDKDRTGFAKTAYPVDNNGITKCRKLSMKKIFRQVRNAEETTTVAETELRTKTKGGFLSKYWKIDKHMVDGSEIRDKDRKTMRKTSTGSIEDGKNVIGEKATQLVNENYPKTMVSSRRIEGESALVTFKRILDKRRKHKW